VFRHFATKDDLLAAIVLDRIDHLDAIGQRLCESAGPGAALLGFPTVPAHQRQQRDLSSLREAGERAAEATRARARLYRTVHTLVDRARDHGTVRADLTRTHRIPPLCL